MSRYDVFAREQLSLWSVVRRGHGLLGSACATPASLPTPFRHDGLALLLQHLRSARRNHRPAILMLGAHVVKQGLSRFVIDLMERGWITVVATNGAGIIHDFELALAGGTSEDVAKWIKVGQFGLWQETGQLNAIIREAAGRGRGLGEMVGRVVEEERLPYRELSIAAAGWRCGVPVTCHVSIGSDIIHALPNCDGAALGQASYTDFLIFARTVQDLEGGVFLNVGTAVTGPEVFLKALSMARNVARQEGQEIRHFTTAVFDLVNLPPDWRDGPPAKDHPLYYFRPWKTLLCRTVADGGTSFYFKGDHRETIPALWHGLVQANANSKGGNVMETSVDQTIPGAQPSGQTPVAELARVQGCGSPTLATGTPQATGPNSCEFGYAGRPKSHDFGYGELAAASGQGFVPPAMKRVDKGWGYELWVVNMDYCGKLLHFQRGKKCSWHYHRLKDEVFYLQSGRLLVRFGPTDDLAAAESVVLLPGMSFAVPPGLRHQMQAEEESDLFEFSTHHEEEDSVRVVKGD